MPLHDLDVSAPWKICLIPPDDWLYFHVHGKVFLILDKIHEKTCFFD